MVRRFAAAAAFFFFVSRFFSANVNVNTEKGQSWHITHGVGSSCCGAAVRAAAARRVVQGEPPIPTRAPGRGAPVLPVHATTGGRRASAPGRRGHESLPSTDALAVPTINDIRRMLASSEQKLPDKSKWLFVIDDNPARYLGNRSNGWWAGIWTCAGDHSEG